MSKGTKLLAVTIVLSLIVSAQPALAQEDGAEVVLTGGDIDVDAGETSTVTAEYEFSVESAGSGDGALTAIQGTLWKVPDRSLGDIAASVDGESVEVTVQEESEHYVVSVPVEDVADGDTLTVSLEYEVSGPSGELNVPLWAPEYPTPGEQATIRTTVTLPEGTNPQGDSFPDPNSVDGNVVVYDTLHVPGFVKVSYDDSPPGLVTMNTLYSLAGVLIILGLVVGGLLIDWRTGRER